MIARKTCQIAGIFTLAHHLTWSVSKMFWR
jgi:hypothetical protein